MIGDSDRTRKFGDTGPLERVVKQGLTIWIRRGLRIAVCFVVVYQGLGGAVVIFQRFESFDIIPVLVLCTTILGSSGTAPIHEPAGSSKRYEYEHRQNWDEVVEQSHSRSAGLGGDLLVIYSWTGCDRM